MVVSVAMMQGEKDAGVEHVFVNSLELTSNDAVEVPPRREPVFFYRAHLSKTSESADYTFTFLKDTTSNLAATARAEAICCATPAPSGPPRTANAK